MNSTILNPSLVPQWFIYSGSMVRGISGADGREYYFIGSSEKGADGKTPALRAESANNYKWEVNYGNGDGWIEVPGAPVASGLIGPQGETGDAGTSVIVQSIETVVGGTQVTVAWGEGFANTSSFLVPSGTPGADGKNGTNGTNGQNGANGISPTVTTATIEGTPGGVAVTISGADGEQMFNILNGHDGAGASYNFDGTTLSGNGSTTNIGVNTDVIATQDWVSQKEFITKDANDLTYYYKKTETSAATELSAEFAKKVNKADLDKYVPYSAETLAIGYNNTATIYDFAQGYKNYAHTYSISQGGENSAQDYSFAQGISNTANEHSFAQSESNTATETAFAQGKRNYSRANAMSQGFSNSADDNSFAQGETNYAFGYAIAQGKNNYAHNYALAQGVNTSALSYSFAQGDDNYAYDNALSQGQNNYAEDDSFAQGASNSAYYSSFTQGNGNSASYEGLAQGINNYAHGNGFAQGYGNIAQNHSFAQGHTCTAIGESFAQGFDCYAENHSQAVGLNTSASYYMMAIGAYNNVTNKHNENAAFVVGNGNSVNDVITRSDAFIIYQDGRVSAAGKISADGVELGAGGGAALTLPLNIYSTATNTVANDAIGAIGNKCVVGQKSFAMSVKGANASGNAFAFGDDNVAYDNSLAFGWGTTATLYSFAGGQAVSANDRSVALGNGNIANVRSFAFGDANTATYWSVAVGRGLALQGSTNASTGFGGLVVGGWNKTSADALFVAGNGTGNDASRSDAAVLTKTGVWSAADFRTFTGNNNLSEKISTTDSPHGSNLKAELAVIAFSDNEIVSFVTGGGCSGKGTLIFRVG